MRDPDSRLPEERLRAALEAAARDWTLTFDAVPDAILVLDRNGRIHRVNRHASLVAQRPFRELLGLRVEAVGPGRLWHEAARLAEAVLDTGASQVDRTVDDAGTTWLVAAHPMTAPDIDPRLILMARDISHLVRLQEALQRRDTMSALGSLVAGVAHEVRNPLFAISGTVDAFEARFGPEGPTARHIETLRREVQRLVRLMRDLLDYGRPAQLELADLPVGPVIRQAIERCQALAQASGVTVTAALPEDLPTVRMDANRMVQVFLNVIENAVQHSAQGGAVTVTAAAGERLEITVADRGTGIRPEDLRCLFEPFFTRRRGGTGLGLSIVQRIVEQHGGEIVVANRPGGGAVTTVRLRAAGHADSELARAEA
jgi:signal transduction histidine kinase